MLSVIINESNKVSIEVLKSFEDSLDKKEFDFHDAVVIGLLEDMIGKTKSLKVLLEANNYDSNDLISRSIFESHLYLKFILEKNVEQRGKLYAYGEKVKDLQFLDRLTETTSLGRELRDYLKLTIEDINLAVKENSDPEYRNRVNEKFKNLRPPEFEKKKWYDVDGKTRNINQLSIKMGMQKEYEIIYRLLSKEVHSSNALSRVEMKENEVTIGKFNINPKLNIDLCGYFLMESSRGVLKYYKLRKQLKLFNMNIETNYKMINSLTS